MKLTRSQVADTALAIVVSALAVAGAVFIEHPTAGTDQRGDAGAVALAAAAGLVLVVRRRWPVAVLAAVTVLTTAFLLLNYPYGPILLSFFVAVYTVACYLPLSASAKASAVALAILLTHVLTNQASLPGFRALIPASGWAVVPFAIGYTVRLQRESIARARAEAVRQRVSGERLRIAQEVHDVVGHGLAAIKMQADIALHVLARKPEQAETALAAISRTSAQALDELRATLAVVRSPAPGLDRLDELRQRMAEAGLVVRLDTTGQRHDLPTAIDLAGYRVVQESLTNALRHSQVKEAVVRVGYSPEAVAIVISNPLPTSVPSTGDGLGIPGMRERVTALGGWFNAGSTQDGRFEVSARIPIGAGR